MQTLDGQGDPVGTPTMPLSDMQNVRRFRVGSAALGGNGYVLTSATVDPTTERERVSYQGFTVDNAPIAGDTGTLDFSRTSG